MGDVFIAAAGATVSADIAVPQHERELAFYASVLTTGEQPRWREDLTNNDGTPIIGLGERTDEYASLPLQWFPHIQVEDVAGSVARALALGGAELMHGKSDSGESLWACLRDPGGTAFGIIPVVTEEQLPLHDRTMPVPGRIAWMDLATNDADTVSAFYAQVVGWRSEAVPMSDGDERYSDYNLCLKDGTPAAGICHARGVNADLPPVWIIYLPVGDLGESLRRVKAQGGTVIKEVRNDQGAPVYAVITDPIGVGLALAPAEEAS